MKKIYPVTNMSCANCALGVEKRLSGEKGVLKAEVSFATKSVSIDFDPSMTTVSKLRSVVQSIGYDMITDEDEDERLLKQEKEALTYSRWLKRNTLLSWIFAVAIMSISMLHLHGWFNYLQLLLAIPVLLIFGRNFFVSGWKHAINGSANMDTLVALSTSIAFVFSLFTTLYPTFWIERGIEPTLYYEASTMIIAFVLLGRFLEERAKGKTSSAIKGLMELQPKEATLVIRDNEVGVKYVQRAISQLIPSDIILVKPGEKIAVDGEVTEGSSFVDESAITGESVAVGKISGSKVLAGTINKSGSFMFRAEKVGNDTILGQIIRVVREAQGSRAPVQRIVDRVASVFVPVVVAISILTFTLWLIFGGSDEFSMALLSAVSVLVIACPCAMGLATPTALLVGIGKAAQNHILIKDAAALEQMRRVDTVVLDKTGTLTEGKPIVKEWIWLENLSVEWEGNFSKEECKGVVVEMERKSEHPLASAVVEYLELDENMVPVNIDSFESTTGHGVTAKYKGETFWAGNLKLASKMTGEDFSSKKEVFKNEGKTILFLGFGKTCYAVAGIADKVKDSSSEAVKILQDSGIDVHMLTGDNEAVASAVAYQTGILHYKAGTLPADKERYIEQLQSKGRVVAMVGDGINDSQALAKADVSIAMGKGTDIAMDVAMMTLITSDLRLLPVAFSISRRTVSLIHQNLFWAFFYNIIGIPVAAGLLYPFTGIMLNPMIAAAAMAFSSISVVLNSLRLNRFNYRPKG